MQPEEKKTSYSKEQRIGCQHIKHVRICHFSWEKIKPEDSGTTSLKDQEKKWTEKILKDKKEFYNQQNIIQKWKWNKDFSRKMKVEITYHQQGMLKNILPTGELYQMEIQIYIKKWRALGIIILG